MTEHPEKSTWPALIAHTEEKLRLAELKVIQLKLLLTSFKKGYEAGDTCPLDVTELVKQDIRNRPVPKQPRRSRK